ncbi:MAG: His-Xaa-Ser system protein HxsD [Parcubacteria group bacterium]|jgi:His-Xaa-Ser system protein HxsD
MQKPKSKINIKENQIVFQLSSRNYPLEAVHNTAYVFLDRAYIYLDGDPEKEIVVSLKGKDKLDKIQLEALRGEFLNELLNYLVRIQIAKQNKKIREFVVGSALIHGLGTDLMSNENIDNGSTGEWKSDPLGIAVPWEDKYEKKGKPQKRKKIARKG